MSAGEGLNKRERKKMPKSKTRKGVAKRFKVTAGGAVKRSRAGRRHLLTVKGRKRKRFLRHKDRVDATDMQAIKRSLPYG